MTTLEVVIQGYRIMRSAQFWADRFAAFQDIFGINTECSSEAQQPRSDAVIISGMNDHN